MHKVEPRLRPYVQQILPHDAKIQYTLTMAVSDGFSVYRYVVEPNVRNEDTRHGHTIIGRIYPYTTRHHHSGVGFLGNSTSS